MLNTELKYSFYNHLIPLDDKKALIYNSFYGGLCELDGNELELVRKIENKPQITTEFYLPDHKKIIEHLVENKFLVNSRFNEIEFFHSKYIEYKAFREKSGCELNLTITPTLNCNLDCNYCFQKHSKNRVIKDNTIGDIKKFIISELNNTRVASNYTGLYIIWFGGEPLLALKEIRKLTTIFLEIAKKFKIDYHSDIITNGTILNSHTWDELIKCMINRVQITIDGIKEIHDKKRPFKQSSQSSYDAIIKGLRSLPKSIKEVTIRVNEDKYLVERLEEFLDNLQKNNIWPQHANQIKIHLAKTEIFEKNLTLKNDTYCDHEHYWKTNNRFRKLKLKKYNEWAEMRNKPRAKLKFLLPKLSYGDCACAVYKNGFVVDSEGYIHKCWELVHDTNRRIQHVSEELNINSQAYRDWSDFDKVAFLEQCRKCKVLPICGEICVRKAKEDRSNFLCSEWKYLLEERIKEQYQLLLNFPELIENPFNK